MLKLFRNVPSRLSKLPLNLVPEKQLFNGISIFVVAVDYAEL